MQITVKSVKVLKSGTNDYGDWKLVQVTTLEDVKYTTLAKDAETITPSSIIDIKDMDKDDKGRESFKKYEVISVGETNGTKESGGDSQEKRSSIEAQKRADIIANLWIAGKIKDTDPLVAQMRGWLGNGQASTPSKAPIKEEPEVKGDKDFEELGEEKDITTDQLSEAGLNLTFVADSLRTLQAKKLKGWSNTSLLVYMKTAYKVEADTPLEAAKKLDKGQATHFLRKIQDVLDMA